MDEGATSCPLMFVTGGAVLDFLTGQVPGDLDITVPRQAFACARRLAQTIGGTFVPLDEREGVARVVWKEYVVDFAQFREGTESIEADLCRRDFTINALAVPFEFGSDGLRPAEKLLDPTGGYDDFVRRVLRPTSEKIFKSDPLRLLRAYRFAATLGFTMEESLKDLIADHKQLLHAAAPERISAELQQVMASDRAHPQFAQMAVNGLLWVLFPELERGVGVEQPASHHLDVFEHSLAALDWMEIIQSEPARFFPEQEKQMRDYLEVASRRARLKWAALFHDLGKPAACQIREGRITFYGHERLGAQQFTEVAIRLRWSREETKQVARLLDLHMWPFHLLNAQQRTGLTAKACLRFVKAAGEELVGLFLLAMADSLAGQGPGKPTDMEQSLAVLYGQVEELYRKNIKPLFDQPRLLTGHDLQNLFGLSPGPLIGRLLRGLEAAQVAGEVSNRQEAVEWAASKLHHLKGEHPPSHRAG